ncbi:glutamate ABC transporter substrate-binding protein [Nocardioides piscis]|uniref:Transporter substrate-binding domain-containing protein n=1 Tax=Nocardioides piscis TaxID=2714938 RepID=A0A6G7YIA8_9ACTN|nr:glutamate ABC transporter substrate-binding protein [Nocardioides piscis]QIK76552.1 transporter substrate-binding domain-containing protein [Nocardioides piscis]
MTATRLHRLAVAFLSSAAVLAATSCGYDATPLPPAPDTSAEVAEPAAPPTCDASTATQSFAPDGGADQGQSLQRIRERGFLIAGVAADNYLLGFRNPFTAQIEGFDIDMVNAIAAGIFGTSDGHVQLRVITAADRIPLLAEDEVDIVARNMTINCTRWQQIAFSAEYFRSGQKLLVRKGSGIKSIEDMAGKRACAPVGTTSIENIQALAPEAIPVTATNDTGCLVKFQNGETDAITTDDTVLAGLAAQDPYAEVLATRRLTEEPYGIGVNSERVDLVRFINRVFERMRADGSWQASYNRWLKPSLGVDATQPTPLYGRRP